MCLELSPLKPLVSWDLHTQLFKTWSNFQHFSDFLVNEPHETHLSDFLNMNKFLLDFWNVTKIIGRKSKIF